MPILSQTLPIKLQSPNVQEHWRKKYARNQQHFLIIKQLMLRDVTEVTLPCRIVMERSGNKLLDSDNYVTACKGIRDSICELLFHKKRGIGDNDPLIEWVYKQVTGKVGLRIEIVWGKEWESTT